jgi:hypothetical protein
VTKNELINKFARYGYPENSVRAMVHLIFPSTNGSIRDKKQLSVSE